jgi:pimeloyl-ACP methyl ester carboxylesterase
VRRFPLALVLTGLLAAACSGTSTTVTPGTPTAGPTTPAPSASATSTASGAPTPTSSKPPVVATAPSKLSAWKGCGSGFQCATLTVPLDPAKPALGTVGLALTRHKATGSRIGSLVINPGGPGASAVEYVKSSYNGYPATLRQHFDLVGFDPRGIGESAPVRCLTTAELDTYFHIDPVPDTAAERTALSQGNQKLTAGCQSKSARILPYVSTAIVARDLDRVREALGDKKLTYLGYSYGTAIGASYLDQFPTHVRAMVLDGALDPTLTWDQLLAGQSQGFDVALDAFLADCRKNSCPFAEGHNGDLHAAFDALAAKVEKQELPGIGARKLGPGEFTLGVGAGLYSRQYGWPAIARGLHEADGGDGNVLMQLSDSYTERSGSGYKNLNESNFAVNCIDRPWPRTDAPYYALADKVGKDYPRFGPAIALSGIGCESWPIAPVGTPHRVTAATSPSVVVIGTTRDPATPYAWAVGLAGQLSHGVLITHNGDGHTVYRNGAPSCILNPVNAYLVSVKVPPKSTC